MRAPRSRPARLAAGAGALLLAAAAVPAFNYFHRPDNNAYIWPTHWTTMYMSNATLPPTDPFGIAARQGTAAWSSTPGSDFRFFNNNGFHDPNLGDLDGANDVYFSTYLGYYTLGVTYVYYTSDNMSLWDCDVAFNGYMYNWYPGYYDFRSVATHEFGHVLGLGHTFDATAVMYPTIGAGQTTHTLAADDAAGEVFLYPAPGGGGGGGGGGIGNAPPGLPTRSGSMSGLTLSLPEVFVGDTLTFTASVQAGSSGQLLLQGAETEPLTTGPWTPVVLQPGEQRGFELVRTVADVPGVYEPTLRLGGVDPTMVYLAKQTLDGTPLTVRRHPVPLPLQDTLAASLGPSGEERVELRLVKGLKFTVELNDAAWEGGRTLQLLDPSGAPVKGFAPGKAAKAKGDGVHVLVIRNIGDAKGNYRLFTAAAKSAPKVKGAGALDGTGPVEVPFFAAARTGGTLSVKGSKKLGARIASLRSPSGKTMAVAPGASVEVEEFGEDGTWTAIVEGAEGESGKVKITGKTAWTAGEQVTR